jgi:long-chain acyl-CoA synthetase
MLASVMKRRTYKNTVFYAKKKHFNTKFLRYVAQKNNIVLVDMQTALRESIQILAKALKNNKNIIIFPEGTRSEDGKVGEFKNLFSVLSRELQVPVIPVAIKGTHKALPKGSHFPRPFTKVEIKFLEPVYPSQEDPDVMAKEVRSRILSVAG